MQSIKGERSIRQAHWSISIREQSASNSDNPLQFLVTAFGKRDRSLAPV